MRCQAGQFFGTTIFLLSLSSAMTVGIIKLHFSGEHGARVPGWLRTLVLDCIAKCLRLDVSKQNPIGDAYQQKKVNEILSVSISISQLAGKFLF